MGESKFKTRTFLKNLTIYYCDSADNIIWRKFCSLDNYGGVRRETYKSLKRFVQLLNLYRSKLFTCSIGFGICKLQLIVESPVSKLLSEYSWLGVRKLISSCTCSEVHQNAFKIQGCRELKLRVAPHKYSVFKAYIHGRWSETIKRENLFRSYCPYLVVSLTCQPSSMTFSNFRTIF